MSAASVLDRRLAAYSVSAGVAIAGASSVSAAIIYTDAPDQTFHYMDGPQEIDIDIDNDGISEITLSLSGTDDPGNLLISTNVNVRMGDNLGYWLVGAYMSGPRALNSNFLISASADHEWYGGAGPYQQYRLGGVGSQAGQAWKVGNFLGRNYKSLAIRFMGGAGMHHGWIRVSVAKDARSFTLHDYAYNTVGNEPIPAGFHMDTHLEGAFGSQVILTAAMVPPAGGNFAATPKVVGYYFDPIKGKKLAKATFKATLNGDGSVATLDLKKKVRLYNAKELKDSYKFGLFCDVFLNRVQLNQGMNFGLDVTLADKTLAPDVAQLALRPPEIIGISPISPENVVTIDGRWFGIKPPKAWVEYRILNAKGGLQTKTVKLKVVKNFVFADAKGKPSCMDVTNGASQFQVLFPAAWPDNFDGQSPDHNLVIDNGVGLAFIPL